jgi:hypothetical protein
MTPDWDKEDLLSEIQLAEGLAKSFNGRNRILGILYQLRVADNNVRLPLDGATVHSNFPKHADEEFKCLYIKHTPKRGELEDHWSSMLPKLNLPTQQPSVTRKPLNPSSPVIQGPDTHPQPVLLSVVRSRSFPVPYLSGKWITSDGPTDEGLSGATVLFMSLKRSAAGGLSSKLQVSHLKKF